MSDRGGLNYETCPCFIQNYNVPCEKNLQNDLLSINPRVLFSQIIADKMLVLLRTKFSKVDQMEVQTDN